MAVYRRVRFLKYFNRPRVFVEIEVDTAGFYAAISLLVFFALSLASIFNPFFSFFIGQFIGFAAAFFYAKFKAGASKGFLRHLLYVKHILKVNPADFKEEVERMDIEVEDYYPDANEKLFIE